jgi:hypothetical protein
MRGQPRPRSGKMLATVLTGCAGISVVGQFENNLS